MKIVHSNVVSELKKTMPESFDRTIDSKFNFDNWNLLDTTDVWTNDGWLVVSQTSPTFLGLRKGDKQVTAEVSEDFPLQYNSNPKTIHYGL